MKDKVWTKEDYLRAAEKILRDHKTVRYNADGVRVGPVKNKKKKKA